MRGRRSHLHLLLSCFCLLAVSSDRGDPLATLPRDTIAGEDEPDLASLLSRLSQVASLYQGTLLGFACEETIDWRGRGPWHGSGTRRSVTSGRQKFSYVYIRDENRGFRNFRTMTGWMPTASRWTEVQPDAPVFLNDALLWIFVFREERQPFHRYRIVGRERVLDRPAVKIEFEPIPPIVDRVNDWYGTAWVDLETAELLQVEAYEPEDYRTRLEARRRFENGERDDKSHYFRRHVTEYAVREHGLRFPSRVRNESFRLRVRGSEKRRRLEQTSLGRVDQTYRDYQFFNVEAEGQIRAVLDRNDPASSDPGRDAPPQR